jgi:hypothetical protein
MAEAREDRSNEVLKIVDCLESKIVHRVPESHRMRVDRRMYAEPF